MTYRRSIVRREEPVAARSEAPATARPAMIGLDRSSAVRLINATVSSDVSMGVAFTWAD